MWFFIAMIAGAGIMGLAWLLKIKGVKLTWYEWLLGIVGFFLVLMTIQNYFGSVAEYEQEAANMFLLVLGLPAVVLLALAWSLAWRRRSAT